MKKKPLLKLIRVSYENNRHQEIPEHVTDKMRNTADQAVACFAVKQRKEHPIDKNLDQITGDNGGRTCRKVRCGKDSGRNQGYRPERENLHPLPDKKAADSDFFTQHDENLIQKHCRKARGRGVIA